MALKILYWLAVIAISLVLLVGLVLFFESRDQSTLDEGAGVSSSPQLVLDTPDRRLYAGCTSVSRAKTMIRCAAL